MNKKTRTEIKKALKKGACAISGLLGRYGNPIWIVGDGRSGTTWVSEMVNYSQKYRELFEPFHPFSIQNFEHFQLNQYLRPDELSNELIPVLHSIFSGRFYYDRPEDRVPLMLHKGLIVKDIFSNLYLFWIREHIPNVRIVFLIRNPFAVAASKRRLRDWFWMENPIDFLEQDKLVEDFLSPHSDFLSAIGPDYLQRQLAIWSVLHYVPLRQLKTVSDVHILFYEDLVLTPELEIPRLFQYLFGAQSSDLQQLDIASIALKPSRLAFNKEMGKDRYAPVFSWEANVSRQEIERGMEILRHFGLEEIYGGRSKPDRGALENFIERS
ncbi:MAG: sulfotransferase [Desulfobacterales bacterium]